MSFVRRVALSQFSKVSRRSFATYKTSTGLVGLNVDPNGRETLLKISNDILESVKVLATDETLHSLLCRGTKQFLRRRTYSNTPLTDDTENSCDSLLQDSRRKMVFIFCQSLHGE